MNKAELVAKIAEASKVSKKDAAAVLASFADATMEALSAGEKVQIVGFGSFEVRERPERIGRNPHTGEQIKIAASKAPVFKAGKALKDAVNK